MEKIQVSQDVLYEYMLAHGMKMTPLAEMIGRAPEVVMSCFKHHNDWHGRPRKFNAEHIALINEALPKIAEDLRGMLITFGSDKVYRNQRGNEYDPACVDQIKRLGKYMTITDLVARVLGWSKGKKSAVLVQPSNKGYGTVSRADVQAINNELLSVAGVLGSYEVVIDADKKEVE